MKTKKAIIIKGNPLLIGNVTAVDFYNDLAAFIESFGFTVLFDPGEPYSAPPAADVWVGHSRGADRLKFAPEGTLAIGIGVPFINEGEGFFVINHPDDVLIQLFNQGKKIDLDDISEHQWKTHFMLTEEMKQRLADLISRI